jgi:hypothetical protein
MMESVAEFILLDLRAALFDLGGSLPAEQEKNRLGGPAI